MSIREGNNGLWAVGQGPAIYPTEQHASQVEATLLAIAIQEQLDREAQEQEEQQPAPKKRRTKRQAQDA